MSSERHRLIVGVDFGTTYTGIAYLHSQNTDANEIEIISSWPGRNGMVDNRTLEKVPTEISYHVGTPKEWGYQLAAGTHRYGCFKLLLDGRTPQRPGSLADAPPSYDTIMMDSGNANAELGLPPGRSASTVTSDFLRFVYTHLMDKLQQRMPKTLQSTPIHFVLTTPAVWSHEAQNATSQAARRAGFGSRGTDSISMVSEPEAAASYYLKDMHLQYGADIFSEGEKIVICDCGGGTVDLITYTVKQVYPVLQLEEAVVSEGGKCGSTAIDRAFLQMVRERVGPATFANWTSKRTGRGSNMMQAFESAKRSFQANDPSQTWYIPVGIVPNNPTQQIEDGEMVLEHDDMENLFDATMKSIIRLLNSQVTKAKEVSSILLVGGFGESEYLFSKIQEWTVDGPHSRLGIKVIRPRNSWSAIARGACLYGAGGVVKSRRLKHHYGVALGIKFVPGKHLETDSYYCEWTGQKMTNDNISWFANKGRLVKEGEEMVIDAFWTSRTKLSAVNIELWSCSAANAPTSKRSTEVVTLGRVDCSLAMLPASAWQVKSDGLGTQYRADFKVVMQISSASLIFKLVYQGKAYGTGVMSFNNVSEHVKQK
ncbi:actin-like ATPase domain-containing protein [Ascobolus immersus RN42]|uniref:Actin-like ATPase domain-containing protein n=1 Tax=Ascobolus immersus RN42 TaxID=1160509 RepID=A0A3N4I2W1_ASCIM|nr:actin-like ATPase domain-containing protein [Ascobolus immersus RN42]